jgi:2-polyprenyl-6-methoxyphenol hydroxylase-like FAD-dependent oxidoreductase
MAEEIHDVLIVGGGPVGLAMAVMLGKARHKVALFERWPTRYGLPRVGGIDAEMMRIFHSLRMGGHWFDDVIYARSYSWHGISGEELQDLRRGRPELEVSGWPGFVTQYQPYLEDELAKIVASLPNAELNRGWEVIEVRQHLDHVELRAREMKLAAAGEIVPTGATRVARGLFLVGADGAKSFVRTSVGEPIKDLGFTTRWFHIDSRVNPSGRGKITRPAQYCEPSRPYMCMPMGKSHYRFEFMVMPDDDEAELLKPETAWRFMQPWLKPGDVEIVRHMIYSVACQLARNWRHGRILLAGDSVHQMPPKLGQGMCSGIRDVFNLSWKFDRILRGEAGLSLLDTYTEERLPHVRDLIELSAHHTQLVCEIDPERARARDEMYLARKAPALKPFPWLRNGIVHGSPEPVHDMTGRLGPQGKVLLEGVAGFADDLLGTGWSVVSLTDVRTNLRADRRTFLEGLQALYLRVARNASKMGSGEAIDLDGIYGRFFGEAGVESVLVRPDFYIFGAAGSAQEFDAVVDDLHRQLVRYQ